MTTERHWVFGSLLAGIVVYYCEWLELISPGVCNQGLAFTLTRMYVVPLLVSGVLGYVNFKSSLASWLAFMLPSWLVRLLQLAISVSGGGNLSPMVIAVDAVHFVLTGVVAAVAAKVRRNRTPEQH